MFDVLKLLSIYIVATHGPCSSQHNKRIKTDDTRGEKTWTYGNIEQFVHD